jgi:hypothetical protein
VKNIAIAFAIVLMVTGCISDLESTNTVSGQVGKGKSLSGTVEIFTADGKLLATTNIDDGKYTYDVKDYIGNVKVKANITKYLDERLNKEITTDSITLSAYSTIVRDKPLVINVTPITTIVTRLMPDISDVSSEKISDYNIFIARKIGLGDEYDPTKGEIKYLKLDMENNQIHQQ